jgi:NADH-quinone oxidoreductase subunit L
MLAAFMTAYYMFRLLFVTFWGEFRGTQHQKEHLHESPSLMTAPLIVLAILSVVGGFIGIPHVLGGTHQLNHLLESVIGVSAHEGAELSASNEMMMMGIAVLVAIGGILLAYAGFKKYNASKKSAGIAKFFENKWYIDEAYDAAIVKPLYKKSFFYEKYIEKMGIDGLVNGIGKLIQDGSNRLRILQSGLVGFYLFLMVLGIALLFIIQLWFNKN